MSYNQNQFVVVQHDIQLTPEQLLVYVIIKKGMDGASHISYVNIGTIMAVSNFNKSTILKYLEVIEEKGYFKIVKCGTNLHYNSYVFPQEHRDEKFERFAFEMIERSDLTPTEKAYLIALQKHLFIDFESGVGRVSYSDLELCQKIQGSRKKLMEVMKSLKEKGIIDQETEIFKRDKETGLRVRQRDFILNNYNTAAIKRIERKLDEKVDRKEVEDIVNKAVSKAIRKLLLSSADIQDIIADSEA